MSADYTTYPIWYRVKKAFRYLKLYGPSKTLAKIRGQYHMRKDGAPLDRTWTNPRCKNGSNRSIAIIGCGNFAYSNIAYCTEQFRKGSIRAAYDPVGPRAISLVRDFGGLYAASDPTELFEDPNVRLIFIASNHATHAEYACEAIGAGKHVHIEKPHVVSREQLEKLVATAKAFPASRVTLGFNRPLSSLFVHLKRHFDAETGPSMVNWFIAGHDLDPDHWYFSEAEGGRILGNLCHWTDLTLRMIGLERAFPVTITAVAAPDSQSDFCVVMTFADGSLGNIGFSAKGHVFEGVREYLNVHRGNMLASLRDFHDCTVHVGTSVHRYGGWFRDHGHEAAIVNSIEGGTPESLEMIAESANLFLGVKEAVESGATVRLERISI